MPSMSPAPPTGLQETSLGDPKPRRHPWDHSGCRRHPGQHPLQVLLHRPEDDVSYRGYMGHVSVIQHIPR